MKRPLLKTLCILFSLVFCFSLVLPVQAAEISKDEKNETIISFINPNGRVLSVAKYGNTRVYPANSIEGIVNAIDLGIDIVTCSVQVTKDKQFVLLSSTDLSELCVGKEEGSAVAGSVADYTLADLQSKFCLKSNQSGATDETPNTYKVASLLDAMDAVDGKAMLMIDNGFIYADEINKLATEKDVARYIILRGATSIEAIEAFTTKHGTSACFVAASYNADLQKGSSKSFVSDALEAGAFVVELGAEKTMSTIFKDTTLSKFGSSGRAFVSTTNESLCGGREDRQAAWSDLIERGYSMIETDYPRELSNYLKEIETYRTELTTLIASAEALDINIYTKDTAKVLEGALKEARDVSAKGCIALDEIDTARYHIQEALDGLVVATGNEKTVLPTWLIILIVVVALLLVAGGVILGLRTFNKAKKEKRKFERFKRTFKSEIPVENDETITTNIAEDPESNMGLKEEDLIIPEEQVETETVDETPEVEADEEVGENKEEEETKIEEETE